MAEAAPPTRPPPAASGGCGALFGPAPTLSVYFAACAALCLLRLFQVQIEVEELRRQNGDLHRSLDSAHAQLKHQAAHLQQVT